MKNKYIYLAILGAAGLTACEPEFDNELSNDNYSAGDADFSSYVAIGNSLTAGFMDGTVSRVSQSYSFPSMLAGQFALVGGGEFTQPSYAEDVNNLGGISGIPGFPTRLVIDQSVGDPEPINGTSTITLTPQAMAFNNMGVPGAKSFHLLAPGYGNPAGLAASPATANPYFVRMATSPAASVIDDALTKNPTFFTNWIGNNDVLGYATSGGDGSNPLTPLPVFTGSYNMITDRLTANGAKGVVATIPSVTSIPYFTTVPYNPVPLTAVQVTALTTGFAQYNGILQQARQLGLITQDEARRRTIAFREGAGNAVTIVDESLTDLTPFGIPSYRQATRNDLIVLPASSFIGTLVGGNALQINGVSVPLADRWVLVPSEQAEIATATSEFNQVIKAAAQEKGLAVADMNVILNQLVSGLRTADGQLYTANYFAGTTNLSTVLFSLDGIHPNARGYAVITNEVIKVINQHYNAKLPFVSAGNFPGPTILPSN